MRAQGSLEYLIIIAAILAIAAIVILFLTGVFGAGKTGATMSTCRNAASRCATERATSIEPACDYCNEACKEVPTKIPLCKQGNTEQIY